MSWSCSECVDFLHFLAFVKKKSTKHNVLVVSNSVEQWSSNLFLEIYLPAKKNQQLFNDDHDEIIEWVQLWFELKEAELQKQAWFGVVQPYSLWNCFRVISTADKNTHPVWQKWRRYPEAPLLWPVVLIHIQPPKGPRTASWMDWAPHSMTKKTRRIKK